MRHFLAILLLVAVGMPRLDLGPAVTPEGGCDVPDCCQPVLTCCGEAAEPPPCPMSDGPCACAAPAPSNPAPPPQAPFPSVSTDLVLGWPISGGYPASPAAEPMLPACLGLVSNTLEGRSHNEIQALLGVWRT